MRFRCRTAAVLSSILALSMGIAGCAIHPLPDDVTGVPTDTIVAKTRCEARAAVKKSLVDWLLAYPEDSAERRLGEAFDSGARPLQTFSDKLFREGPRTVVQTFQETAIAYDFTLDITEVDNLDAGIDLLNPFHKGTSSAALGIGLDRTRQSQRVFTVSDTFRGLLQTIQDDYCAPFDGRANAIYPIIGNIGIAEEVHIFIEMTLFDNLKNPKGPPTMADTLIFTTKISGSAAPRIAFNPVGTAAHVMDASLMAVASRTDIHKVVVGLALPPPPSHATHAPKGLFVTVNGTPAQQAAGDAIDQTYLRRAADSRGTLILPVP